jgi:hypothetical protein
VLIEGKELCINLERGYAGNVPEELASVVERHVARRRVLAARDANSVDYELEGSILVFYGLRVRSDTKTVDTTLMGLPGAVIDEHTAKARGRVVVAFSDLRLHNLQDGTSKPLQAVGVNVKGDSFNGGCNSIFKHVDNKLQEVVETLSIQIEETIRTWPKRSE